MSGDLTLDCVRLLDEGDARVARIHSYWMLKIVLIPDHVVFDALLDVFADGVPLSTALNSLANIDRCLVDFAASTNSSLVVQLCFSLMYRRTSLLMTAARRSQGPLPDCGSEKSIRRINTPVLMNISRTQVVVPALW
jgi:hypothetical protein